MTIRFCLLAACAALWVANPAAAEPVLPSFNAANFSGNPAITHPYFPVVNGQARTYEGAPADEQFTLTGMGEGPVILGVKTFIIRDRAVEGGLLVEDTFDYYAQDRAGNVWYMGEDVTNYHYDKDGNLIGTDTASAWRAGVNGALPGYIMPKSLAIGFNYYQEHAPEDDALDQATTMAILPSVTVAAGTFSHVLQVLETSELDRSARGFKYYARGVGLIKEEEGLRPNNKHPRQTFELTSGASSNSTNDAFRFREVPDERRK